MCRRRHGKSLATFRGIAGTTGRYVSGIIRYLACAWMCGRAHSPAAQGVRGRGGILACQRRTSRFLSCTRNWTIAQRFPLEASLARRPPMARWSLLTCIRNLPRYQPGKITSLEQMEAWTLQRDTVFLGETLPARFSQPSSCHPKPRLASGSGLPVRLKRWRNAAKRRVSKVQILVAPQPNSSAAKKYSGMKSASIQASALPLPPDWKPTQGQAVPTEHVATFPLRIGGERFMAELDNDAVYIRHDRWSLLGSGQSLSEAEADLRQEAGELAEVLAGLPPHTLDVETMSLFRFVLRIG